MQALPAGGAMAAVFAPEARVAALLAPYRDRVAVAAVNGPEHVVISGAGDAVQTVVAALNAAQIKAQPLAVSHAFHSPLMDPILDRFQSVAATLRPAPPRVGWVSNVTGRLVGGVDEIDAAYWRRHLREPVRFGDGMRTLWSQGSRVFVEIGPGTTLVGMGRSAAPAGEGAWLPTLRRGRPDWTQVLETLAELWIRGVDVDWKGFDRHATRRKVALPTSPFERARYWLAPSSPTAASSSASGRSSGHPLIGRRLRSAVRGAQFEAELGSASPAYLEDHRVHGAAVLPVTAFVEMFLAAGARMLDGAACRVEDLTLQEALILPEKGRRTVQLVAGPAVDGRLPCEICSLVADEDRDDAWRLHATATVRPASSKAGAPASRSTRSALDAPMRWSRTSCTQTWPRWASSIAARSARSPACGAPTARRSPTCGCPPTSTPRPTKSTRRCSMPVCSRSPRCCRTAPELPAGLRRARRAARAPDGAVLEPREAAAAAPWRAARRSWPTSVSSTHPARCC